MAKKAQVSIITPTYNRSQYLREAIESALNQTYRDWELIIFDDGSTDDTKKMVKDFQNEKIKYFWQKHTGSPAKTRNKALAKAKGEYIAFLDSDDVWVPEKLEKQIEAFNSKPNISVVFSNGIKFGSLKSNGHLLTYARNIDTEDKRRFMLGLCETNFIILSSVMLKADCLKHTGYFDDRFIIGEDWELWMRLARHHNFYFLNEPLVKYRTHPNRFYASDRNTTLAAIELLKLFSANPTIPRKIIEKSLSKHYFRLAKTFVKEDGETAKKMLEETIKKNPLNMAARIYCLCVSLSIPTECLNSFESNLKNSVKGILKIMLKKPKL